MPMVSALVTAERDLVLFGDDHVTPRFLATGTHQTCAPLTRFMAIRELKVPIREWQRLAITDRSQVHDQHRLGVTLTRAPVDPFANANQPISSRSNGVVRDAAQHHPLLHGGR